MALSAHAHARAVKTTRKQFYYDPYTRTAGMLFVLVVVVVVVAPLTAANIIQRQSFLTQIHCAACVRACVRATNNDNNSSAAFNAIFTTIGNDKIFTTTATHRTEPHTRARIRQRRQSA